MRRRAAAVLLAGLAILGLAAGPGRASDLGDFHAMVAEAYAHYRGASFYFGTGNAGVALDELKAMRRAWGEATARFADTPPDAFADDSQFDDVLAEIGRRIETAIAAAKAGDAAAGRTALAPVRDRLGELRRRNGVVVLSDRVNALNAQMDRLYVYRHTPPAMDDPTAVDGAVEAAAVYAYLLRQVAESAPAELRDDDGFRRLIEGAAESVARLPAALRAGDETAFVNMLRELAAFDRMIFLRFG